MSSTLQLEPAHRSTGIPVSELQVKQAPLALLREQWASKQRWELMLRPQEPVPVQAVQVRQIRQSQA
jgi:hypothetical protein